LEVKYAAAMIFFMLIVGVIALVMDTKLKKEKPGASPYAWGYFIGLQGVIFGIGTTLFLLLVLMGYMSDVSTNMSYDDTLIVIILVSIQHILP